MILILLCLVLVQVLSLSHLLNDKAEFIFTAQNWCLSQITEEAVSKPLVDAFLCGANIPQDFIREPFVKTGLIHLLVVSGGHFAFLVASLDFFLSRISTKFPWIDLLKLPVLLAFSFITGFQAPVVRALTSLLLHFPNRIFHWHWDQGKILMVSGIFILSLFPHWLFSLSFYLSWLASIGLCFSPLWKDNTLQNRSSKKNSLLQWVSVCVVVQTLLSLFFWNFSWLSLLMNLFFAPLLMLLLWPLCLTLVVIPPLAPVIDTCWNLVLAALRYFSNLSEAPSASLDYPSIHWLYLWIVIVILHCILEILTKERFQKSYA